MKVISLRLKDGVYRGVVGAAEDGGRSINGQIEWMLRQQLGGIKVVSDEDSGDDIEVIPDERSDEVPEIPDELDGSFEDWVEWSGIGGVLRVTKADDELEYNELSGYRRAELRGELVKLRGREGVTRGDVDKLARRYGIDK